MSAPAIVDTNAAAAALTDLVATIENTGGLVYARGVLTPAADEDWSDLTFAYLAACKALGRKQMIAVPPKE